MATEILEKKCAACKVVFAVTLFVSVALLVAGFLVPPTGAIDGSVLKAVGELFAFAALAVGMHAIQLGYDLKIQKGDTTIQIGDSPKGKPAEKEDEA